MTRKTLLAAGLLLLASTGPSFAMDETLPTVRFLASQDSSCPSGYKAVLLSSSSTAENACLELDLTGLVAYANQQIGLVEDSEHRIRSVWMLSKLQATRPDDPETTTTPVVHVAFQHDDTCPQSKLSATDLDDVEATSEDLPACAVVSLDGLYVSGKQSISIDHDNYGNYRTFWHITDAEILK